MNRHTWHITAYAWTVGGVLWLSLCYGMLVTG
jgi:hypothetical protein